MKAMVSAAGGAFEFRDVAEPEPRAGELLVRVEASSISPRDLRLGAQRAGFRAGADFAGVVEQAAGRSGPQVGAHVAGVLPQGCWAERIAVPARSVAAIPADLDSAEAAALAAAGLTALYALDRAGPLPGRRVLVTGANGMVGRLACRIAAAGGARVTGWVRREAAAAPLAAEAIPVVAGESVDAAGAAGPFDAVIELVGGEVLSGAVRLLAQGGRCMVVGNAAGGSASIDPSEIYMNRRELIGFALFPELEAKPVAEGLPRLFSLAQSGAITASPVARLPAAEFRGAAQLGAGRTMLTFG